MNGASQGCCPLNKKLKNKNMNHKEALQKIADCCDNQNESHEIFWRIATEALQSESEQHTSPSIEKKDTPEIFSFLLGETDIDGLWFGDKKDGVPFWWRGILRKQIEGYKSNNHFDELEKWVKEEIKDFLSSPFEEAKNTGAYMEACILTKIQELKTKQ